MPEPIEIHRLTQAIRGLPGVRAARLGVRNLAGITERELSLPGEFGDLPHLAIRRTHGGLSDEVLVSAVVWFEQDFRGWVALEFLAWWARDLSRGGQAVQMRPLALPPVGYGTQLGRTLKFVLEFFFINQGDSLSPVLKKLGDLAESLEESRRTYAKVIDHPTETSPRDFEALRRCAENDDGAAQLELARRYATAEGVDPDPLRAFYWHERAAGHGHPTAVTYLGLCYARGEGTPTDPARAVECYRRAAEAGEPMAMGLLAECLEEGRGVAKNEAEAVNWYRQGAEAGELACLAQLGECYEYGRGVPKDLAKALECYRQAREQGFEPVQPAIERVEAEMR